MHLNTSSTDFLFELLSDYEIETDYSNAFRTKLLTEEYSVVIHFQGLPDLKDIGLLSKRNTVIVPMYDQVKDTSKAIWFEFRRFKFLSFSRRLHTLLTSLGFQSQAIQYFPKIELIESDQKEDACVFWVRDQSPNIETFFKVMKGQDVKTLHLREKEPSASVVPKELGPMKIQRFQYSKDRQEYTKLLDRSKFLFASRNYEGIGLSFLEAMSRGVCVIAPDLPTMNEYIVSGRTGVLYDPADPQPTAKIEYQAILKNLVSDGEKRHQDYLRGIPGVLDFLNVRSRPKPVIWILRGFIFEYIIFFLRRIKWKLKA